MIPKKHDFSCYKGQTWKRHLYFTKNGEPVDFTGTTVKSQIRKVKNDSSLAAEFDCIVNIGEGSIILLLTAEQTSNMNPGMYVYDVKCTDDKDEVQYYIYGNFEVTGRVTI